MILIAQLHAVHCPKCGHVMEHVTRPVPPDFVVKVACRSCKVAFETAGAALNGHEIPFREHWLERPVGLMRPTTDWRA